MPRKSLGTAPKRDRSSSLSDLDNDPAPPVASRGRASKAAGMARSAAALKESGSEASEEEKPTPKKARVSKGPVKRKKEEEEEEEKLTSDDSGSEIEVNGKGKAKAKANGTAKVAAAKAKTPATKGASKTKSAAKPDADGDGDAAPKPKKTPKAKAFPPPDLDPALAPHPPRLGHPVFKLPSLTVPPNGGIGPSDPATIAARPMLLGAHVSIGGGPAGALLRASKAGANGLGMFVKSQRQWKSNPYEPEAVERFRALLKPETEGGMAYGAEAVLVHGSYLINLGNPDETKWKQAYECFVDDLKRCHQLGLRLYNWHPGSTVGACTKEESYATIAKAINMAHKEVPDVICVVENMANAGSNIIGTTFQDLAGIISLVEDKSRVRVCLDTCHLFAAGYDIRTPETYAQTMKDFNDIVGNGYLGGMHFNDSKMGLGEKKDLHENIGLGKIGLSAFRSIMRDPLMAGIPLVLETPAADNPLDVGELAIWMKEIELLYRIQSIEDEDWAKEEEGIRESWRIVRDKMNPPKEKAVKGKGKKGKKGKDEEDEEED